MSNNLLPSTSAGGFSTTGNVYTGNISATGAANLYAVNVNQSIVWPGASQIYEDTVIAIQGNAGVFITSPNDTQINANTSSWTFANTGVLTLPGEGVIYSNNDTINLKSLDTANGIAYGARIGTSGGLYLEQGNAPAYLTFDSSAGNAQIYAASGLSGNAGHNLTIYAGSADEVSYNTSPGGNIYLRAGAGGSDDGGGGGPGGSINITAGDSLDPAGHAGNVTVNAGTSTTWKFDYTGNLIVPGNIIGNGASPAPSINGFDTVSAVKFSSTGNVSAGGVKTDNYYYANGTPVSFGGGSYGNADVATFLGSYGSNVITTTGNIASGNLIATANVLGNGYARFTGSFDESQASTAGLYLGYAGGTPRMMFGTGNTLQTFEIDNDGGTLRFYQPGSTKASLYSDGAWSAAGNVTGSNVLTSGVLSATGNVRGGNINTAGLVSATGNVQGGNILTGGIISATGNINSSGNLSLTGSIVANNITGYGNIIFNQTLSTQGGSDLSLIPGTGLTRNYGNFRPYFANSYDLGGSTTRWNNVYANVTNSITESVTGNITGGNVLTGGLVSATGNLTSGNVTTGIVSATGNVYASNFIGNISIVGNVQGTQSNVTLVAGSYNWTFDNTGNLTLPSGSVVNKASGLVNAGTYVTLDNIKATLTASGNRGLSLATVSGSFSSFVGGTFAITSSTASGGAAGALSVTTSPSTSVLGWNFTGAGDISTYILTDTTNSLGYRITLQIGSTYLNNLIVIERLV